MTENLVLSSLQEILGPGQILELFKNFGQDQRNRGQNDEIFDNTMGSKLVRLFRFHRDAGHFENLFSSEAHRDP